MLKFNSQPSRWSLVLGLSAAFASTVASPGVAQSPETTQPVAAQKEEKPPRSSSPVEDVSNAKPPIFNIEDSNLNELSGMAASRKYAGYFWAHNDSGDTARLFLLSGAGKTVAIVNLEGMEARDWEDMTATGSYLYIGDMGDNFSVMENIKIHRIKEPKINLKKLGQQITVAANDIETATVSYPDGPHDAETLAATADGTLLIVSKSKEGSNFYVSQTPFRRGVVAMKKIGEVFHFGAEGLFTKLATGGDLSRDGKKLAVTTYSQLYEFRLGRAFDFTSMDTANPAIQNLPSLRQCESACYDLQGHQIFVSSEKKNPPVYALDSLVK